jgi:hypothetical protein
MSMWGSSYREQNVGVLEQIINQQNAERAAIIEENRRNYEDLQEKYDILRDEVIKLRHQLEKVQKMDKTR